MQTIDVIIPVYKPGEKFYRLLTGLSEQTMPVNRIIVYNTEQEFFEAFDEKYRISEKIPNLSVYHHTKREFDHGRTRNRGVAKSKADLFLMMTDDAVPADRYMIEKLYEAVMQEKAAVSYARQLSADGAGQIEEYTRKFNYPESSLLKTQNDIGRLGIKTYFCSNVCAMYRRDIFDALGGFIEHTIFNEDMIYAAKAAKAGYGIAYAAQALVIHSHNYTAMEQFHRNFDLGVSHAEHPEVFDGLKSESEGIRLVLDTQRFLFRQKSYREIFRLYVCSAAKFAGYKFGKNYRRLPAWFVLKCCMNSNYFQRDDRER